MLKCLLTDESAAAIRILKRFIAQVRILEIVGDTGDPMEAIKIMHREQPDLVFVNYQPELIAALQALKAAGRNIKIILCTGHPEWWIMPLRLGADAYLFKVFTFIDFKEVMENLLPGHDLYQRDNF